MWTVCLASSVKFDVRLSKNFKYYHSNLHASKLEVNLASLRLKDAYQGDMSSGFTRECATVATRIDRMYSRAGQVID